MPALSRCHSLGLAQFAVLRLEQVELLGEEDGEHEEQEHHEGGRAHGHAQHLEVGDDGLAACPLVPRVVLRVAPARRGLLWTPRPKNVSPSHRESLEDIGICSWGDYGEMRLMGDPPNTGAERDG